MGVYRLYKEELISILLKLFQNIKNGRKTYKLIYEARITLIAKPNKDPTKKENYRPISLMNMNGKIFNKMLAN